MVKNRLKYIAAAAFGAGAILLASGAGTHLIAFQGPAGAVHANASDVSPSPEASPSPESSPSPEATPPVTVPAATPTPDDEATEAVEDANDVNEAAEPAEAAEVDSETNNDDNGAPVAGAPAAQPEADGHGSDEKGD